MTGALTIWTYDWVPAGPRGYVRDIRLRWACEEAGLDYEVKSVSFKDREPDHIANQPFGQSTIEGCIRSAQCAPRNRLADRQEAVCEDDVE